MYISFNRMASCLALSADGGLSPRRIIVYGLWGMVLLLLFMAMAQPVATPCGKADLWAAYGAMAALGTVAGVWLCGAGRGCGASLFDGVVALWLAYVVGHCALSALYPCGLLVTRAVALSGWYVALRLWLAQVHRGRQWLTALLVAFALYEACSGLWQMVEGASRHEGQLMTGSFLNSGPFALCLMAGLVLVARWRKEACWVVTMALGACMALTTSRAALVGLAVGVLLVFRRRLCRRHAWWLLPGVAAMALLLWMKVGSALGRVGMAWVAVRAMQGSPWTGWGVGGFAHRYAEQMACMSASLPHGIVQCMDVPEYAFNTWLLIGVEQGLVGCVLALLLLALLLRAAWRGSAPAAASVALCVAALFSYPFSLLPLQLMFVAMVACVASEKTKKGERTETLESAKTKEDAKMMENAKTMEDARRMERGKMSFASRLGKVFVCLMGALAVVWCLPHTGRRVEAESQYALMRGAWGQACLRQYDQLMPWLLSDPRFLFSYAKTLQHSRRYSDSNAVLRKGTLVSADPMFYVLMGNNDALMHDYRQAEAHYRKAHAILPNRLYPLYRLMLLYQEMGDRDKMQAMAHHVLAFKEKRPSAAVREMRRKAQRLLGHEGKSL